MIQKAVYFQNIMGRTIPLYEYGLLITTILPPHSFIVDHIF